MLFREWPVPVDEVRFILCNFTYDITIITDSHAIMINLDRRITFLPLMDHRPVNHALYKTIATYNSVEKRITQYDYDHGRLRRQFIDYEHFSSSGSSTMNLLNCIWMETTPFIVTHDRLFIYARSRVWCFMDGRLAYCTPLKLGTMPFSKSHFRAYVNSHAIYDAVSDVVNYTFGSTAYHQFKISRKYEFIDFDYMDEHMLWIAITHIKTGTLYCVQIGILPSDMTWIKLGRQDLYASDTNVRLYCLEHDFLILRWKSDEALYQAPGGGNDTNGNGILRLLITSSNYCAAPF